MPSTFFGTKVFLYGTHVRAVLQRVSSATVHVEQCEVAAIGPGWVAFVAIARKDGDRDIQYIVDKTLNLRMFSDAEGRFNHNLTQVAGDLLVVSQFTLMADCRKGRRPSFAESAPSDLAFPIYQSVVEAFRERYPQTVTGQYQVNMQVALVNDGPVTVIIDSQQPKSE